jgi:hypothetical protein
VGRPASLSDVPRATMRRIATNAPSCRTCTRSGRQGVGVYEVTAHTLMTAPLYLSCEERRCDERARNRKFGIGRASYCKRWVCHAETALERNRDTCPTFTLPIRS